jgi:hypothetical protein
LHLAKGLIELALATANHGDLGTFACKSHGNGPSDPGSSTCNDGTFSGQACHVISFLYV